MEAQFVLLKNRTKEINIIGLLEKLTSEFNDHYKVRLLGVAIANVSKGLVVKMGRGWFQTLSTRALLKFKS